MTKLIYLFFLLIPQFSIAATPVISTTATRTCDGISNICTAPTAVIMNAKNSTADVLADGRNAFHYLEFKHEITTSNGNVSGVSTYGAVSNYPLRIMRGPLAAYIFHTPGIYVWTLCAVDNNNLEYCDTPKTFVITSPEVTYSATNTTCINATGNDYTGCPLIPSPYANFTDCITAGKCVTQSNFNTALSSYLAANKRVLFKGGDTFDVTTTTAIPSNVTISSFGLEKAIVKVITASTSGVLNVNTAGNDYKIYNIDFNGNNVTNSIFMTFRGDGSIVWQNLLIYNNIIRQFQTALNGLNMVSTGSQGVYIANSEFKNMDSGMTGDMMLISEGFNIAIVNNLIQQGNLGQQVLRFNRVQNIVTTHNTIEGSAATKEMISHRPSDNVNTTTAYVVTSNNILIPGNGYTAYQNGGTVNTAAAHDFIIEGNYIYSNYTGDSKSAFDIIAENVSLRNNVIIGSNPLFTRGVSIRASGAAPVSNVWIDNNTIYANRATGLYDGIYLESTTGANFYARNNLVHIIGGVTGEVYKDLNTPDILNHFNNTGDVGTISTDPLFNSVNNGLIGFRINTLSIYKNSGIFNSPTSIYDAAGCIDKNDNINIGALWPEIDALCFNYLYLPFKVM